MCSFVVFLLFLFSCKDSNVCLYVALLSFDQQRGFFRDGLSRELVLLFRLFVMASLAALRLSSPDVAASSIRFFSFSSKDSLGLRRCASKLSLWPFFVLVISYLLFVACWPF